MHIPKMWTNAVVFDNCEAVDVFKAIIAIMAWYAAKKDREDAAFMPDGVKLVCGKCGYKMVGPTSTLVCPRCGEYLDVSAL